ncbi:MAG: class I SAM-dependent methyltransferase [Chloroflexaceae bacterium]|nr:class I SAM-dependent methyltransferase [Chloroflexaceae bacterium]
MAAKSVDIGFIPTPYDLIPEMLTLARAGRGDVLYDLGCGDGRIAIRAARQLGMRAVGIDIDPERIREAEENAQAAGVADLVTFRQENLFECDFREATVVVLYLLPHLNLRLRPALLRQLRPGARIVSRDFDLGDWPPQQRVHFTEVEEEATLYCWEIPDRLQDLAKPGF